MAKEGFTITNFNQVVKHMMNLDLHDKLNLGKARKALRIPFNKMRKDSRTNLDSQKSNRKGDLRKGLSVSTKAYKSKGYFSVAFGGRAAKTRNSDGSRSYKKTANHFHLVNSGTVKRRHKSGKNVGAVGKATTSGRNMNKSYKVGFADRAIRPVLPTIKGTYIKAFNEILNGVKTKGV